MNNNETSLKKYSTLITVINDKQDTPFINELDALLLKKRFDNAYELSLTENILHVSSCNLTSKYIKKIITDFLKNQITNLACDNRNLYELIKISNLESDKVIKAIDENLHIKLISALENVSHETSQISFDFLILRLYDNFMLKSNGAAIKNEYIKAKYKILKKLTTFNYEKETREKETTFLCWVDRLLYAIINKEITPNEFIVLCKKIFILTTKTVYFYWKILHSINYILLQQEFSANADLRAFKKEVSKTIGKLYNAVDMTTEEIKELTASILSKKTPDKEDFYYLFDALKITSQKNHEYKLFCLKLCKYIINHNYQYNIFCYRFIRKYFIESFFDIIENPITNIDIKVEEVSGLISLFHIDTFFCFYRQEILTKIIDILKTINDGTTKLTYNNFYKFCDSLDYMMSENKDILIPSITDILSLNIADKSKLMKYFQLALCYNS